MIIIKPGEDDQVIIISTSIPAFQASLLYFFLTDYFFALVVVCCLVVCCVVVCPQAGKWQDAISILNYYYVPSIIKKHLLLYIIRKYIYHKLYVMA